MGKKSYDELSELEKLRWDFWNTLRQHLLETRSFLRPRKSDYAHWLHFSLGVIDGTPSVSQYITVAWCSGNKQNGIVDCSRYHVRATYESLNNQEDNARTSRLWLEFMRARKQAIHSQLGFELEWDSSRNIEVYLKSRCVIADIRNLDAWPGYINDMRIQAEHLHTVFQPHALAFNEAHLHG